MRTTRYTAELLEAIRRRYAEPGATWAVVTREFGVSKAGVDQHLYRERYLRGVRRRADRELKKLKAERAGTV